MAVQGGLQAHQATDCVLQQLLVLLETQAAPDPKTLTNGSWHCCLAVVTP
jgi:hypothetical protein